MICLEEGEDVKHFCGCDKEVGLYHKKCLRRWLAKTWEGKCEFCKKRFDGDILFNLQWEYELPRSKIFNLFILCLFMTIVADKYDFFTKYATELDRQFLYMYFTSGITFMLVGRVITSIDRFYF